jgi:hypothetical protein
MEKKYKYGPFIVLGIFIFAILLYVNSFGFIEGGVSLSPLEEEGLFDIVIYVVVFLFLVFVVGFIVLFVKNRKDNVNYANVVMESRSKSVPQFQKKKYKNL